MWLKLDTETPRGIQLAPESPYELGIQLPGPTVLTDRTCVQWASANGLGRPSSPHVSPSKWATRIVRANMLLCTAQYKEEELPDHC